MRRAALSVLVAVTLLGLTPPAASNGFSQVDLTGPSVVPVGETATFLARHHLAGAPMPTARFTLLVDGAPADTASSVVGRANLTHVFAQRGNHTLVAVAERGTQVERTSAPLTVRAAERPSAPADVVATAVDGALRVRVDWTAPVDDGGSAILGYRVLRQTNGGNWTQVGNVSSAVRTHLDTGHLIGSTYQYAVVARNVLGESAWYPVGVTGPRPEPATLAVHMAHGSANAWLDAAPTGGTTQQILLERSTDNGATWGAVGTTAGTGGLVSVAIDFNKPLPVYRATARSLVGDAIPTTATATGEAPPAPGLTVTPIANSWDVRLQTISGGGATQAIEIQVSRDNGATWSRLRTVSPGASTTEWVNLWGTKELFRARARNLVGDSIEVPATPVGEPPGVPQDVRVVIKDDGLDLAWTPPTTGGPAQMYVIRANGTWHNLAFWGHTTMWIASWNQHRNFTIEALNYVGTGPASAPPIYVHPPAPPTLTATPVPFSTQLRLDIAAVDAWTKELALDVSTDGGNNWLWQGALKNTTWTRYHDIDFAKPMPQFRVYARGPSGDSTPTIVTPSGTPPSAPTGVHLAYTWRDELRWTPPASGTVQQYVVRDGESILGRPNANATSFPVTLPKGRWHNYTVQAVSYAGEGPRSESVIGLVDVPSAPSVTAHVSERDYNGVVNLTWTPPTDDGGAPIGGYEIWRTPGPFGGRGKIATLGSSATRYDNNAITADGRTYTYEVIALNRFGAGDPGYAYASLDLDWNLTYDVFSFHVCEGSTCTDVALGGTYDRQGTGAVTWSATVGGKLTRRDVPRSGETIHTTGWRLEDGSELAEGKSGVTDANGDVRIRFNGWTHTPNGCETMTLFSYATGPHGTASRERWFRLCP